MLWFRTTTLVLLIITLILATAMLSSVFVMCTNPSNEHAMKSDPYYNNTLWYYVCIIFAEAFLCASLWYGLVIGFRIWRNRHQLDHKLRKNFSFFLALDCFFCMICFILGIMGMVRYKEPQELIMSLFEIFSEYNQDVKFVGSFERYQRENSCCGINGPDDWMLAQFKQGGGGGGMGNSMAGGYDSFMGSPSTGKCHLVPPTIPMGCGKKLTEDIEWTKMVHGAILIFETLLGWSCAVFSWYCFFYWIEKEVIIIPEDEVSNLIVIEPESSVSTSYTEVSDSYGSSSKSRSFSSVSQTGSSRAPTVNSYLMRSGTGYSFHPNTIRTINTTKASKISNANDGVMASVGGPHSAFLSMTFIDPRDEQSLRSSSRGDTPDSIDQSSFKIITPNHNSTYTNASMGSSIIENKRHKKLVKRVHSSDHLLKLQAQALGGKLIAQMRVDHTRDSEKTRADKKHHYGTLAVIKAKHPPTPNRFFETPEHGHGQTGHLATDIWAMSGGAAAAKSIIDNVNLPVAHDKNLLQEEPYLRIKKRENKELQHPDKNHPGYGPLEMKNGVLVASAADDSQMQMVLDTLLKVTPEKSKVKVSDSIHPHGKDIELEKQIEKEKERIARRKDKRKRQEEKQKEIERMGVHDSVKEIMEGLGVGDKGSVLPVGVSGIYNRSQVSYDSRRDYSRGSVRTYGSQYHGHGHEHGSQYHGHDHGSQYHGHEHGSQYHGHGHEHGSQHHGYGSHHHGHHNDHEPQHHGHGSLLHGQHHDHGSQYHGPQHHGHHHDHGSQYHPAHASHHHGHEHHGHHPGSHLHGHGHDHGSHFHGHGHDHGSHLHGHGNHHDHGSHLHGHEHHVHHHDHGSHLHGHGHQNHPHSHGHGHHGSYFHDHNQHHHQQSHTTSQGPATEVLYRKS